MSQINQTVYCTYTHLANGIHEYVLADSSRAAYDEFLVHLDQVFREAPADEILRSLVDFRHGLPPLQYAFQRTQALLKKYPKRTDFSRVAYLHMPGAVITLVQTFISLFRLKQSSNRFFTSGQREEAIAWLLGGKV